MPGDQHVFILKKSTGSKESEMIEFCALRMRRKGEGGKVRRWGRRRRKKGDGRRKWKENKKSGGERGQRVMV